MKRATLLEQLDTAEQALRARISTATTLTPPPARTWNAPCRTSARLTSRSNEIGKARSVQRLVGDLEKVDRLVDEVRHRQQPGVTIKPIRI